MSDTIKGAKLVVEITEHPFTRMQSEDRQHRIESVLVHKPVTALEKILAGFDQKVAWVV